MYTKKNKKSAHRYPGTDSQEWKVIDYLGNEYEIVVASVEDGETVHRWVSRWVSYRKARNVARYLGNCTAVRA